MHLQDRLNTMIGKSSGFLETLPPQMRARIEFLRELQDKHDEFFEDYQKELKALREKYETKYGRLPHRTLPWLSHPRWDSRQLQCIISLCCQSHATLQQACCTCA